MSFLLKIYTYKLLPWILTVTKKDLDFEIIAYMKTNCTGFLKIRVDGVRPYKWQVIIFRPMSADIPIDYS